MPNKTFAKSKHDKKDPFLMNVLDEIKSLTTILFENIKSVRLYTKANYFSEVDKYMKSLQNNVFLLDLPDLVLMKIFTMLCPKWLFYKHKVAPWCDAVMDNYELLTDHQLEFKDMMVDMMDSWDNVRKMHIHEFNKDRCNQSILFPRIAVNISV
jgi:hypothetical protein